ncbi:MAG: polysulfide reductase NrfD [Phycisphaerae bacterium]|jgi:formate-dependent nitrite reductase membrane component NrfD
MIPNLKAQSKWRWLIAVYLFLAGLGGGAYVTGVVADYLGDAWVTLAKTGVFLGFPCVAVGCVFLLLDLGTPANFWRAGFKPGTSWIARGTIIISIFMVVSLIHAALWVWPFHSLVENEGARRVLGIVGSVFAFGTMIYTGILLGAARPIAFWSTAMLPLLFLVSALSTGIMAVILVGSMFTLGNEAATNSIHTLATVDIMLIILEIVVLLFYLQGTHRVPESRASAEVVLMGEAAPLFWWGVAVLGLIAPLVFDLFDVTILASACGIVGGLCLRQVVLMGGIHAPLKAGRFEIALPIV